MGGLTILNIFLSVKEPSRDLELLWVSNDRYNLVDFLSRELTSTLALINICLLADHIRESATNTLDGGKGIEHLLASINVGVEDTQDMLEVFLLCLAWTRT